MKATLTRSTPIIMVSWLFIPKLRPSTCGEQTQIFICFLGQPPSWSRYQFGFPSELEVHAGPSQSCADFPFLQHFVAAHSVPRKSVALSKSQDHTTLASRDLRVTQMLTENLQAYRNVRKRDHIWLDTAWCWKAFERKVTPKGNRQ